MLVHHVHPVVEQQSKSGKMAEFTKNSILISFPKVEITS